MAIGWFPCFIAKSQRNADRRRLHRFRPELQTLESREAPAVQVFQSFDGLDQNQSGGLTPPDTIGLITPTHAVEMTNSAVGFYNRTTGAADLIQTFDVFYQDIAFSSFLFDPICIYDDVAGRIILIAHDVDFGQERAFFAIAVSNTSNPLDGFTEMQSIEVTEQNLAGNDTAWGDNAKVGQTRDAIIISSNVFGFNSGFSHSSFLVIEKASVYDQDVATLTFFDTNRAGVFSQIPANMHEGLAGSAAWFTTNGGSNTTMRVTRMDNILSNAPTHTDFNLTVPTKSGAPQFRQPGGGPIAGFDQRVLTVNWRNNRMVASHIVGQTVQGQNVARVRWYEFDLTNPNAPALVQSGNVGPDLNAKDTYHGAVDIAANMDIGVSYLQSGSDEFMSMYVTGRRAGDPLGTMQTGVRVKAGVGLHNSGRAGDYGGIGVDPTNPNRFWGFNEYAKVAAGIWGTWISEFEILPDVVAAPDFHATAEDTPLTINAPGVLGNDTTLVGPLSAALVAGPANGNVVVNADGSFTYTPNLNFFGTDTFTYRATAGASSDVGVVTITVVPVNDKPLASDNPGYFVEGGTILNVSAALGVLANDTDPDGDTLSAILGTTTAKGTLFLQLDGGFTYTPNAGATGFDTFTYRAFDGQAFSGFATATIQINSRPLALADSYSMLWNRSFVLGAPGVLANDTDLDGDVLTAELVTTTANGTLNFVGNGGFTYTPNANYYGTDSFTYRVRDPFFVGNTVTVSILVEPTPVAGDDAFSAFWGQYLDVPAPGLLMNDVNLAGGGLFAVLVGGPLNGNVTLNANGSFRFLAVNNFVGVDTFTYKARTASGVESNIATVRITVSAPPNRPPVAVNDAFAGFQGTPLIVGAPGVRGNDSDPDGDPFTALLVAGAANGTVNLAADGSFTYTPTLGFAGVDTFTYQLTDGLGFSNVATVTLQINPGTPPPAGADDAYVAQKNQSLTINAPGVLLNDTDPLGRPLTALLGTTTTNGLLFLNANGSFSYTPNANFTGTDQFTYRAVAAGQPSNLATVTITVTNPALPPLAAADSYQTQKDTPLFIPAFGVLGNDSDPQALPLTAQLVAGPATGALQLNANGSFLYTPALGFTGQVSFTYQASNGLLLSNVATATIHVTPGPGGVGQRVVVAPDAGFEPRVKVFDGSSQTELASFLVFEASFRGGVRVATADLTADGIPDIIVASGPGRASTLKVYDGNTLQPLAGKRGGFSPFSGSFGLFVTTGDVNGDGTHDLIVGQDAGGSPQVKVFDGKTGNPFAGTMGSFLAYASNFRGGVRVAAGDVNGDGKADVITAPGVGTISGGQSGRVKTFDLARRSGSAPFLLQQFNPYGTFTGGVFVASGDLDGDGRPELITAPGAGLVGEVKIYAPNSTVPSRSFTPLGGYTGGLRPSVGDVNGDGRLDLILGTGTGTSAKARFYDAVTLGEMFPGGLEPFGAAFTGGLFAAGLRTGR